MWPFKSKKFLISIEEVDVRELQIELLSTSGKKYIAKVNGIAFDDILRGNKINKGSTIFADKSSIYHHMRSKYIECLNGINFETSRIETYQIIKDSEYLVKRKKIEKII